MPSLPNAALHWLDRTEEADRGRRADRSGHQGRDVTSLARSTSGWHERAQHEPKRKTVADPLPGQTRARMAGNCQ
jgi:hypothetical protein